MVPGESSDPDSVPERSRFLFVVARTRPDLLPTLRRQFQDDRRVEVMLDRREHERRSQPGGNGVTERRRPGDRRRPRDYWEDTTHHPAVLIPVTTASAMSDLETTPAAPPREPVPEPPMERLLVDDTRLRAWVEESQRAFQQLLPALLDQRAALVSQLHEATRRADQLQRDNDALRAEIARTTAAHHQLTVGHADVVDSVSLFLGQLIEVLEPVRVLAEKQNRERPAPTA
jgi:hypothetical protein